MKLLRKSRNRKETGNNKRARVRAESHILAVLICVLIVLMIAVKYRDWSKSTESKWEKNADQQTTSIFGGGTGNNTDEN